MSTQGASGAPSQDTINYDALLSTTLAAYRNTMVDNIFKDSAFLAYLRMVGAVRKQNGGQRIQVPLMYGKNETVKTVGGYEILDTTPQDGMTSAFYEWAEIAGTISISRKEQRQNSGEARLLDLLQQKIRQAEMSMREELNRQLILGAVSSSTFVPETSAGGNLGILPLFYFLRKLVATDPTTGGNVGNISGASNSWWRPNAATFDGTADTGNAFTFNVSTLAGLAMALKRMYNYCSRGSGGSPDIMVGDQITYESYENSQDSKVRYQNTRLADLGFDNVKLRQATFIWDELIPDLDEGALMEDASTPAGTVAFLNTKFYDLTIDSETDIVTTPFIEPENQTAKTAKVLFMGNTTCSNMRKLGVCYAISQSLTS